MANSGPGYTVADLVYYAGLFTGIIVTYLLFQELAPQVHKFISLLVGLVVGVGLGWVFLQIYENRKRPPTDQDFPL